MADAWRMLEKSERYVAENIVPPRGNPGYLLLVKRRGHEYCGCLLSEPVVFWREHTPVWGTWPVHYLVADEWKRRFLDDHPEFIPGWNTVAYASLLKCAQLCWIYGPYGEGLIRCHGLRSCFIYGLDCP